MTISQLAAPVQTHANYERLIARAKRVPPATTVVVHPCDQTSLLAIAAAAEAGHTLSVLLRHGHWSARTLHDDALLHEPQ